MTTAYKVVRVIGSLENESRVSVMANDEAIQVVYQKGIKTVPVLEGSRLFAFINLEYAQEWLANSVLTGYHGQTEIWECEAEVDEICSTLQVSGIVYAQKAVISFWEAMNMTLDEHPNLLEGGFLSRSKKDRFLSKLIKIMRPLTVMSVPPNTVLCNSIVLQRCVQPAKFL